jgi:hypothetical protein
LKKPHAPRFELYGALRSIQTAAPPPRPKARISAVLATVGGASDDGDRAVVHQDLARRIAADHDRVVGAVTEQVSTPEPNVAVVAAFAGTLVGELPADREADDRRPA